METTNKKRTILLLSVFLALCCLALVLLPVTSNVAYAASGDYQKVTIRYLERVGESPFAVEVDKDVYIPVYANNRIEVKDVCKALGYKAFGVLQSYCDTFTYENGVYIAYYYKSVHLSAKTVDGNNVNYFLDVNNSFEDYYYQFVTSEENAAFTSDTYEWFWNKIHVNFPETANYKPNELHGYWGFVMIPHAYSFNDLWTSIFGNKNTFSGVLSNFMITENLSYSAYNSLLKEYNYAWYEIAWADIAAFFTGTKPADCYMFYVESDVTDVFIAENGATDIDDNDSAFRNDVESVIDTIGNVYDSMTEAGQLIIWGAVGVLGIMLLIVIIFLFRLFVITPVKVVANSAAEIIDSVNGNKRVRQSSGYTRKKRK